MAACSKGGDLPAPGRGGEETEISKSVDTLPDTAFGTLLLTVAFESVGTFAIYRNSSRSAYTTMGYMV